MAGTRPPPAERTKRLRRAASSERRPSSEDGAAGGMWGIACVAGATGRSTAARISTRLPPRKRSGPHGCTDFERRMTASGPSSSRTRRITSVNTRPLNHLRCMRELRRSEGLDVHVRRKLGDGQYPQVRQHSLDRAPHVAPERGGVDPTRPGTGVFAVAAAAVDLVTLLLDDDAFACVRSQGVAPSDERSTADQEETEQSQAQT